ncbi:MAG: hypothetical protein AB7L94_42645, partial [Kofleriaceae bacterium]
LAKQKKAGREVDRAQRGRAGRDDDRRGGKAAGGAGGKLRLGVSHRGISARGGDDDAPRGRGKPSAKPGKKRR